MEYTKETTDRFLNLYRQLETIRDFDQGLYSYYKKKYYEQFDEYRQIRNYLSHEEYGGGYPVAVSSLVCDDLERILCQMRKTCYDIATKKVVTYTYSDPLAKALNNFANHGVTYVPIVENKRVKGIVTAGKLLLILSKAKKKPIDPNSQLGEYKEYFALDNHSKRFIFMGRKEPMAFAERNFSDLVDSKRVGLIIVTENGEEDEAMLGVISIYDVVKEDEKTGNRKKQ